MKLVIFIFYLIVAGLMGLLMGILLGNFLPVGVPGIIGGILTIIIYNKTKHIAEKYFSDIAVPEGRE